MFTRLNKPAQPLSLDSKYLNMLIFCKQNLKNSTKLSSNLSLSDQIYSLGKYWFVEKDDMRCEVIRWLEFVEYLTIIVDVNIFLFCMRNWFLGYFWLRRRQTWLGWAELTYSCLFLRSFTSKVRLKFQVPEQRKLMFLDFVSGAPIRSIWNMQWAVMEAILSSLGSQSRFHVGFSL